MPTKTPKSIAHANEHCMKPIPRLGIHFGIDYRKLSEMLKATFVSIVNKEFEAYGKLLPMWQGG